MQLLTFQIFCDLVETGSFSQSAVKNRITQSAVSQQIRVLEDKFNVSFFERGGKKFSVTAEGEIFARAAREVLEIYDNIGSRLNQLKDIVSGPLRVSTAYSIGLHELPIPLSKFREENPHVDVQVEFKRAQSIYDDVLEGRADIGLVSFPVKGKGIIADIFDEDDMVIICSPLHKLAKRKRAKIKELQGESFVSFEPDTPTRKAIDRVLKLHSVTFAQQHEFDTIETVKRAVEVAGVVSIVPRRTVDKEVEENRLIAVKLEDTILKRPLGILRKQGHITTPAMREFINSLIKGSPIN